MLEQLDLSDNKLMGSIPSELGRLKALREMNLNGNTFTGTFPSEITLRCDSEDKCQPNSFLWNYRWILAFLALPLVITILLMCVKIDDTDLSYLHSHGSVYCFILTKHWFAWIIHFLTVAFQILVFQVFLQASGWRDEHIDWNFSLRSPDSSITYVDMSTIDMHGWVLVGGVIFVCIGKDLVRGLLQLHAAGAYYDVRLFICGSLSLYVSLIAVSVIVVYDLGVAETNVNLIVNTLIILLINNLDAKVLLIMKVIAPKWTRDRINESLENIVSSSGSRAADPVEPFTPRSESSSS